MLNKTITAIIEIPKDSAIKYEFDRHTKKIKVDRILRSGFKYPANYGFIENTLDWDGDELDVLVYSEHCFITGVELEIRIIGAMQMLDEGQIDTKLIGVHHNEYQLENLKTLQDLPQKWLDQIQTFFSTYKNWKGGIGTTKVIGFKNANWAWKEYQECISLHQKYGHLDKATFLTKMKIIYPKKYDL